MSWLKLKRLLPHRKVWKVLTDKLRRSKAKKKPKSRSCKKLGWPSLSIQPKKFKKKPNCHTVNHHRLPPPVFIDELFIEPRKEKLCSLESGKEEGRVDDDWVNADEAWESMVLASPQMNGINQRAEEFIARFRADMRHQEMQLAPLL